MKRSNSVTRTIDVDVTDLATGSSRRRTKKSGKKRGSNNCPPTKGRTKKRNRQKSSKVVSVKKVVRTTKVSKASKPRPKAATAVVKRTETPPSAPVIVKRPLPRPPAFRINQGPYLAIGKPTFLSGNVLRGASMLADVVTSAMSDRAATPQQIRFVRSLNTKFKTLKGSLGADFRAYCGGKHGYVVRRFTAACPPTKADDDILSANKPIGMGPVGLDKYFMKNYGVGWTKFLDMSPTAFRDHVRKRKQADDATTVKATEKAKKRHARKVQKAVSKPTRTSKPKSPPKPRPTAPVDVEKPTSTPKPRTAESRIRKQRSTMPKETAVPEPTPAPMPKPEPIDSSDDASLDKAERDMAELKALLQKAVQ